MIMIIGLITELQVGVLPMFFHILREWRRGIVRGSMMIGTEKHPVQCMLPVDARKTLSIRLSCCLVKKGL